MKTDLFRRAEKQTILGAGSTPLPTDPCRRMQILCPGNVVLTPHAGGNTADNVKNMVSHIYDNLIRFSEGKPLPARDLVNNRKLETPVSEE
jgi:phosphoglycerate dehydrogenase-like enzyme